MVHSLEDSIVPHDSNESNRRKSNCDSAADSNYNQSSGFDCNICLDPVQDPVVTLCGHLYCWPCIYRWLEYLEVSSQPEQCPVCKSEISQTNLIPLYGRGQATRNSRTKARQRGNGVPPRPLGPVLHLDTPRSDPRASNSSLDPSRELYGRGYPSYSQPYISHMGHFPAPSLFGNSTTRIVDPIVGILGEMVHERVFGNSMRNVYTYPNSYNLEITSPRLRRLVMQADKSLGRICFFLFCCCILCLLLF